LGGKKTVPLLVRAQIGIVAGGGRTNNPLLKAGIAYHKYSVKRNCWPKIRGIHL
jgi:large subunit ribosomal protein L8e